jgi:hypothetical protein
MGTNTFYNKMRDKVANKLLKKFGGTTKVTLKKKSSISFDVATQTNSFNEDASDQEAWAVVAAYDITEIDDTIIKQKDLRLVMAATEITTAPTADDTVVWQGITYRIMTVDRKSPGGVDIAYICQLRI